MSDFVLISGCLALLVFWAMGAYNRLVRLRSHGIAAFLTLEGLLNQFPIMVKSNLPVHASLSAEHSVDDLKQTAWFALDAAAQQFHVSLKMARIRPFNGSTMSALRSALNVLGVSWSRLRDLPPDLAGAALPSTLQSQWEYVALQVAIAQNEFNRAIQNYNAAIDQFPAIFLAWIFGFKPAQPI
jgi:LemA protein